jgi:hypothetical protein
VADAAVISQVYGGLIMGPLLKSRLPTRCEKPRRDTVLSSTTAVRREPHPLPALNPC